LWEKVVCEADRMRGVGAPLNDLSTGGMTSDAAPPSPLIRVALRPTFSHKGRRKRR